tara:strand:- start:172 stop:783 length:612 start_codon:yes stop_codon:yes gene_type:complete
MKGIKMKTIKEKIKIIDDVIVDADKVTKEEITKVINSGIQTNKIEVFMTDVITRDIYLANKKNAETLLTKKLDDIYNNGSPAKIEATKKWVKTRLQVLIKAKTVQKRLLGKDVKTQIVTIKKVNNGVLTGDKCLNTNQLNKDDLGKFKVIVEAKKPAEEKTFEEELSKLMVKYDKFPNDLIVWLQSQMTDIQIMEELESKKVA